MCMVDEGEGWAVSRDGHRVASRPYRCYECDREIAMGERYYYLTGIINGDHHWETYRLCAHCDWAAGWLRGQCNGFLFGGVQEDLRNHWDEDVLLRDFDLGRRIVGMRRRWRRRDGSLMPVPSGEAQR